MTIHHDERAQCGEPTDFAEPLEGESRMKRYAIADYLTLDQRRAIANAQYLNVGRTYKQRITAEGCCPLGILDLEYLVSPSAPDGETVALTLLRSVDPGDRIEMDEEAWIARVTAIAQEFIDDWDQGRIPPTQLPVALGLEGGPHCVLCDELETAAAPLVETRWGPMHAACAASEPADEDAMEGDA